MSHKELAAKILKLVGGRSNVDTVVHCYTRLRFNLIDDGRANMAEIKQLDGVVGVQRQSGQFQVVIGNSVGNVYKELTELPEFSEAGAASQSAASKQKINIVSSLMETIAGIFSPIIPAIAGAGMLKGILGLITTLKWAEASSDSMRILALIADCFFYFLPFFLAVSAARKFKTSEYLALALAGGLMYPTIIDAAKTIAAGKEVAPLSFLGMPIGFVNYSSTVIPIIIAVWLMSYVYRFLERYIPSAVKTIFAPALVLIIMIPIELIAIGPAGSYLGTGLAEGVQWLFERAGFVAGFAFAGARPLITMVGMHYGLMPISLQNLAQFGYDYLLPLSFVANMGQAAAAFAVFLKTKNKTFKVVAASTSLTALLGITEPAMYGVNLKLKKPFIAALIGAGSGGAFLTIFNVKAYGFVLPGITALPVFVGPEFIYLVIGALLTVVITIVLTFIFGFEDVPENAKETGTPTSVQSADVPVISVPKGQKIEIASPLNGRLLSLTDVPDEAFSTEAMGKGVAVEPVDGRVYAPFEGTVETVFRTKHVIALKSLEGVEILIHVGIDTVKLQGKHFNVLVQEGQKVAAGELLLEFDLQEIRKAGYETITPVIVTNSMDYTHVVVAEPAGSQVSIEKQLLTVIK